MSTRARAFLSRFVPGFSEELSEWTVFQTSVVVYLDLQASHLDSCTCL